MGKRLTKKPGRAVETPLSDRERILMTIITQLSTTQMLRGSPPPHNWSSDYYKDTGGGFYTHFASWQKPKAGDLVLATTGRVSPWKVGFYVEPLPGDFGGSVIREIGSDKLCNYANEEFRPIVGLSEIDLFEGKRREFYIKVLKAFSAGDKYLYRFGGLRFDGETAIVRIREAHAFTDGSTPFEVAVPFRSRISVKSILAAMVAGGYGTKSFKPEPDSGADQHG